MKPVIFLPNDIKELAECLHALTAKVFRSVR